MRTIPSREAQGCRARSTYTFRCLLAAVAAILSATTIARADEPRLRDLEFDPTLIALAPGESIDVTIWGVYDDETREDLTNEVTLSSRDPESVVTSGNTITALAGGNAVIDAEHVATGTEADEKAEVEVLEVVELTITPALSTITAGTSVQLAARAALEDGRTGWDMTDFVEWEIDIDEVASVDQTGLVTGLAEGITEVEVQDPASGTKSAGNTHFVEVLADGGPVEVDEVVVSPLHSNLLPGETVDLVVTLLLDDGSQHVCSDCTFRSLRSSVAGVSSGGRVTALAAGETRIKVEHPGSGRFAEEDPVIWVGEIEQIDLSPRGASIGPGDTVAFRALASHDNGRVLDITDRALWSSNDAGVASVSDTPGSKGVVLGVDLGGAEITARDRESGVESDHEDGAVLVSLTPSDDPGGEVGDGDFDPDEVRRVVVDPPTLQVFPGDDAQVAVYAVLKDGTSRDITERAKFKVRSRRVARAASGGLITALEGGETDIRAEDPLSRKRTRQDLRVRVTQMVSLRVSPAEVDLQAGEQIQLKAYADFDDGSVDIDVTDLVFWESDRESVATIDNATSKGLLTAASEGTTRIRAEDPASGERSSGSTGQVTVDGAVATDPAEIVELRFEPAMLVLAPEAVGRVTVRGVQLDGTVVDLDAGDLRFGSESRRVASIGRDDTVVARRAGRTRIVVKHRPTETEGSFLVTVRELERLRIEPATIALRVGQTFDLAVWGSYNDDSPDERILEGLKWRSEERSVVEIDKRGASGRITAVGAGTGLIEVRHRGSRARSDGSSGIIRVVGEPVRVFVMPETAAVELGAEQQFEAFGVFEDGTVVNISDEVSWSLSDASLATIDSAGLLSRLASGTFEVRAQDQWTGLSSNDVGGNAVVSPAAGLTGLAVSESGEIPETPTTIGLAAGEAVLLKGLGVFSGAPQPTDLTASLVWTSSNPDAVPVDGAGLVSCAALGVAQISVRDPESGIRSTDTLGDAVIHCASDVTGLKVTPLEANLDYPNSRQMRAFRVFGDGREVEVTERVIWTSSDPDGLAVVETGSEGGRVTALDDTIATISAFDPAFGISSNDAGGQNGTINVRKTRTLLEIFPNDPEPDGDGVYRLQVGDVIKLKARVTFLSGVTQGVNILVEWQSNDDTVLRMSPPGENVNWGNALAPGTVTVTARWPADEFSPELTASVTVEVLP